MLVTEIGMIKKHHPKHFFEVRNKKRKKLATRMKDDPKQRIG